MERKSELMERAHLTAKEIYKISLNFPQKYQFSIGEQLRRAVLSIPLNITEGNARISSKEKRQFLNIAFGSVKEVKYLIFFCKEVDLLNENDYRRLFAIIDNLAKLLYGVLH